MKPNDLEGIVIGKDSVPVIDEALITMMRDMRDSTTQVGNNSFLSVTDPNFYNQASIFIQNNKHNQVTSTYYLILKKMERETGRNYVFEQVLADKSKRYANSMGNLSTVNFGSPGGGPSSQSLHKMSASQQNNHHKIMNQTAMIGSGFFSRVGANNGGVGSQKSSEGQIDLSNSVNHNK